MGSQPMIKTDGIRLPHGCVICGNDPGGGFSCSNCGFGGLKTDVRTLFRQRTAAVMRIEALERLRSMDLRSCAGHMGQLVGMHAKIEKMKQIASDGCQGTSSGAEGPCHETDEEPTEWCYPCRISEILAGRGQ